MGLTTNEEQYGLIYAPIPRSAARDGDYVLLPLHPRRRRTRHRRFLLSAAAILLLSALLFLLFPSDPKLTLSRAQLNNVKVKTTPHLSLYLSLTLTLRVRNRDFISLNYSSLAVAIAYRGRELGVVTSHGGEIRARGSSYVVAEMVVDGAEVIHDVIYLIEDLARGTIPFDTVSEVRGSVGLFFVDFPIKTKVSCEVDVNINNQTVVRQDCYPV